MQTTCRRYQNPSPVAKDTFAVKGIVALLMCVAYAGVLFCIAALISTLFRAVTQSAKSICVNAWKVESCKAIEVTKPLRNPTRHGHK